MFQLQNLVYVYYNGGQSKCLVGRLLLKDRKIFFEYDLGFVKTGLELSPFKLPLKNNIIASADRTFDGLFGVFNDSLPDGWGRLYAGSQNHDNGFEPWEFIPA
jgi:serine/threonine-protein kinase HipA